MPDIEPLNGIPDIFVTDDPNIVILWQKTGTIAEIALRHMPRGLAYSVMLSRVVNEIRTAYGADTARRMLAGFIEQESDLA
jgi:hypothetical protein